MKAYACPSCHSRHIRRSRRRSVYDDLLAFFRLARYRCYECGRRFYKVRRIEPQRLL